MIFGQYDVFPKEKKKSLKDSLRETNESIMKWSDNPRRTIYANAGVCYLCREAMPVPEQSVKLTLDDVVCDGCKKSGFWK